MIFMPNYNKTGCSPEIIPPDIRAWCNGADINQDGHVSIADYNLLTTTPPWGSTGCNLPENWEINCYSTLVCSGNTKSDCESKPGCSWIPESINCTNPFMQAVWNSTSGILADGAFDREGDNPGYLNVIELNGNYVLSAPGDYGEHRWHRSVVKNFSPSKTAWGGTIYANFKYLIPAGIAIDMVFLGAYSDTSNNRNLGIATYIVNDKNYIYIKGYYKNSYADAVEGQMFLVEKEGGSEWGWPDRFIRIDWFFTPDNKLFGRVDNSDWKSISPLGEYKEPFTRLETGWISSFNGGNVYIKNITLYPESCIPDWMT